MAEPNNRLANLQETLSNISRFADRVDDTSFSGMGNILNIANNTQIDGLGLLQQMADQIDNKGLNNLASDMINVLGGFYADQEALCCLIQNLLITTKAKNVIDQTRNTRDKFIERARIRLEELAEQSDDLDQNRVDFIIEQLENGVLSLEFLPSLVYSIDSLVAVIDVVLIFLKFDVRDIILPILDLSKLLSSSVVGMLIIALQQIVFALRDESMSWIINQLEESQKGQEWIKCLPYMDFLDVLKKYIHDHGMLDRLFKLINGHIGDLHKKFSTTFDREVSKNLLLIELLKQIREILLKMKNAAINWELCIGLGYDMDTGDHDLTDVNRDYNAFQLRTDRSSMGTGNPENNLNRTIADDGTILNNNNSRNVNNSTMEYLLTSLGGMSPEQATQMTSYTSSSDNIQGSLSDNPSRNNNDCGYVLNDSDTIAIVKKILTTNGIV